MNEVTHTPGPWTTGGDDGHEWVSADPNANVICDIVGRGDPADGPTTLTEEDGANARLIAAAPDLLAACEDVEPFLAKIADEFAGRALLSMASVVNRHVIALRAAMARAKGGAS